MATATASSQLTTKSRPRKLADAGAACQGYDVLGHLIELKSGSRSAVNCKALVLVQLSVSGSYPQAIDAC